MLSSAYAGPPRVLVTHQVNITALTNVVPRSGELIVVQPLVDGQMRVIGHLDLGGVTLEPGAGSP